MSASAAIRTQRRVWPRNASNASNARCCVSVEKNLARAERSDFGTRISTLVHFLSEEVRQNLGGNIIPLVTQGARRSLITSRCWSARSHERTKLDEQETTAASSGGHHMRLATSCVRKVVSGQKVANFRQTRVSAQNVNFAPKSPQGEISRAKFCIFGRKFYNKKEMFRQAKI